MSRFFTLKHVTSPRATELLTLLLALAHGVHIAFLCYEAAKDIVAVWRMRAIFWVALGVPDVAELISLSWDDVIKRLQRAVVTRAQAQSAHSASDVIGASGGARAPLRGSLQQQRQQQLPPLKGPMGLVFQRLVELQVEHEAKILQLRLRQQLAQQARGRTAADAGTSHAENRVPSRGVAPLRAAGPNSSPVLATATASTTTTAKDRRSGLQARSRRSAGRRRQSSASSYYSAESRPSVAIEMTAPHAADAAIGDSRSPQSAISDSPAAAAIESSDHHFSCPATTTLASDPRSSGGTAGASGGNPSSMIKPLAFSSGERIIPTAAAPSAAAASLVEVQPVTGHDKQRVDGSESETETETEPETAGLVAAFHSNSDAAKRGLVHTRAPVPNEQWLKQQQNATHAQQHRRAEQESETESETDAEQHQKQHAPPADVMDASHIPADEPLHRISSSNASSTGIVKIGDRTLVSPVSAEAVACRIMRYDNYLIALMSEERVRLSLGENGCVSLLLRPFQRSRGYTPIRAGGASAPAHRSDVSAGGVTGGSSAEEADDESSWGPGGIGLSYRGAHTSSTASTAPLALPYTHSLETAMRRTILDPLLTPHMTLGGGFTARDGGAAANLRRRFLVAGLVGLLVSPVSLLVQTLQYVALSSQEVHATKNVLGPRTWSPFALVLFRGYNELPHAFHRRVAQTYEPASRYLREFSSPSANILGRFVATLAGAALTVLLGLALVDDALLMHVNVGAHNLLFVSAALGVVLAGARAMMTEHWHGALQPESALSQLGAITGYLPRAWQQRPRSQAVRSEVAAMFQFRALLFLQEVIGAVATPLTLLLVLPSQADDIARFLRGSTVQREGLGAMCKYAAFDTAAADVEGEETGMASLSGQVPVRPPSAAAAASPRFADAHRDESLPWMGHSKMEQSAVIFRAEHPD